MTRAQDDLQARARKRYQALRRKQRDPRFRKVMGRFVAEGLLATTIEGIPPHDKRVPLEDALWAGTVEPPNHGALARRAREEAATTAVAQGAS